MPATKMNITRSYDTAAFLVQDIHAATSLAHEKQDLSGLTNDALILVTFDHIWLMSSCAFKIAQQYVPDEAAQIAHNVNNSKLNEACIRLLQLRKSTRHVEQLLKWKLELSDLDAEVSRRLKDVPVGHALLEFNREPTAETKGKLLKLITRKRDLRSYQPTEYNSDDLQQEALTKLERIRKKIIANFAVSVPPYPPPFPKGLGLRLKTPSAGYRRFMTQFLRTYLPVLEGHFEKYRARPGWTTPLLKDFFAKNGYNRDRERSYADQIPAIQAPDLETLASTLTSCYSAEIALALAEVIHKTRRENTRKQILTVVALCSNGTTSRRACQLAGVTAKTFRNHIPRSLRSQILKSSRHRPFYRKCS
jgi:hypothetical protein